MGYVGGYPGGVNNACCVTPGYGAGTGVGAILVLFILLVIISRAFLC